MDPPFCPFCVVELPPVPLLAELLLLVPLLGEVVAAAG